MPTRVQEYERAIRALLYFDANAIPGMTLDLEPKAPPKLEVSRAGQLPENLLNRCKCGQVISPGKPCCKACRPEYERWLQEHGA